MPYPGVMIGNLFLWYTTRCLLRPLDNSSRLKRPAPVAWVPTRVVWVVGEQRKRHEALYSKVL